MGKGWDLAEAEALEHRLRVVDYASNPQARLPALANDWSLAQLEDCNEAEMNTETLVISEEHVGVLPPSFEKPLKAVREVMLHAYSTYSVHPYVYVSEYREPAVQYPGIRSLRLGGRLRREQSGRGRPRSLLPSAVGAELHGL